METDLTHLSDSSYLTIHARDGFLKGICQSVLVRNELSNEDIWRHPSQFNRCKDQGIATSGDSPDSSSQNPSMPRHSGVNFINILLAAFKSAGLESANKTVTPSVSFCTFGIWTLKSFEYNEIEPRLGKLLKKKKFQFSRI